MNTNEIKQELERGYKVFRAFESGLAVIQEIDTLEARAEQASKELLKVQEELAKEAAALDLSKKNSSAVYTELVFKHNELYDALVLEYKNKTTELNIETDEASAKLDKIKVKTARYVAEHAQLQSSILTAEQQLIDIQTAIAVHKESLAKTLGAL